MSSKKKPLGLARLNSIISIYVFVLSEPAQVMDGKKTRVLLLHAADKGSLNLKKNRSIPSISKEIDRRLSFSISGVDTEKEKFLLYMNVSKNCVTESVFLRVRRSEIQE